MLVRATKKEEGHKLMVRRRFVKLHGESAWQDFNYYLFKLLLSQRAAARMMRKTRWFVRYWKEQAELPPKRKS
jgi:hypothetical protein